MAQTLTLEDVVASAMDSQLQNVWTSMPGRVETYEPSLQRANVRITVKSPTVGQDGDANVQSIAVLNAVPVVFPGGSSFRFVSPLQAGDTVLLIFTSRSIDKWLTQGGIVDPGFTQKHHISDAVAIPILRDFAHPLKNSPSDHASIGHDEGATIEFRQGEIRLGSDAAVEPLLRGSAYLSAFATLMTAVSTAVGTSGTPAGATAAAASIVAAMVTFTSAATSYLSTTTKVV